MVDTIGPSELAALQMDCSIPNIPTQLTYHLRLAPSFANADAPFGSYAYQWRDKPHRMLYMACSEAEALQAENERLRAALNQLARLGNGDKLGNSHGNMIARQALGEKT